MGKPFLLQGFNADTTDLNLTLYAATARTEADDSKGK